MSLRSGSEEEPGALQRGGLWEDAGISILKTLTLKTGTSRLYQAGIIWQEWFAKQ